MTHIRSIPVSSPLTQALWPFKPRLSRRAELELLPLCFNTEPMAITTPALDQTGAPRNVATEYS